jgi:phenylalanyl-tRNA synthetase alpha chain
MLEKVKQLFKEVEDYGVQSKEQLEEYRQKYISKKSEISDLFADFKNVAADQKREFGQELNKLKQLAEEKFKEHVSSIADAEDQGSEEDLDLTLPTVPNEMGGRHPISVVRGQIIDIFRNIGFSVSDGPEIEDDYHNFTALNFPENHPAREMQDTFFIEKNPDIALRTHTSSVQVRLMESGKPPFRSLMPGRVYRNEAISARAHCVFHQIEGLYVDKKVSFADMKQTMLYFAQELFGEGTKIRLRPSYFPFTEPSAELDIYWGLRTEQDKRITKGTGWLEIGGCGMVDPNVLTNAGIDPEEYSGFAFGVGVERITMLKYQIKDLRLFTENDVRFLKQFQGIL